MSSGTALALEGRVAIVTGGSKGLGLAMAKGFARAGADVVVASRKLEACEHRPPPRSWRSAAGLCRRDRRAAGYPERKDGPTDGRVLICAQIRRRRVALSPVPA